MTTDEQQVMLTGSQLRRARSGAGITQAELATEAHISRATLSALEGADDVLPQTRAAQAVIAVLIAHPMIELRDGTLHVRV